MRLLLSVFVVCLTVCIVSQASAAFVPPPNGHAEYQTDAYGYYYMITGGKFPTGTAPNGDNGSGGTFRFLVDDPLWGGYTLGVWHKDDWFPENASFALTLKNEGQIVYDNNGIEDGSYGDYYDATGLEYSGAKPGLYRGYSMSNNFDWIYAGYFMLEEPTTFDTIIGYFDENSGFDRNNPNIAYRMNIWSNVTEDLLPAVADFTGDVFSSDNVAGSFATSDTGVDRIFGADYDNAQDDIFRLVYTLDQPLTLDAGVYWFSHDAMVVPEPSSLVLLGGLSVCGLGWIGWRRSKG